jgi:hypothetical protein
MLQLIRPTVYKTELHEKNNRLYSFQDGDFDIKVIGIIKLVL